MTPKLLHKLLAALIVASLTSIVLFALIAHWYAQRSFLRYLNEEREARLAAVATELRERYAEEGSWDSLRGDPRAWRRLLFEVVGRQRELAEAEGEQPPQRFRRLRRSPLLQPTLYDAGHEIIAGRRPYAPGMPLEPIRADGRIVGYVGLPPLERPTTARDVRFARRQAHTLAIAAGCAFLLSVLIAIVTARVLVRPIMDISRGARALASGRYDTRLPPLGRDEIGALAEDFNVLARSLEESESGRRRWIADISHELRTPLAIMRGEIEAVRDGIRPADERMLNSLAEEVDRLARLVEDLYQLARADIGALDYEFARTSLAAVTREAVERFAHRFAAAGLDYDYAGETDATAMADRRRLMQMLENIFENCCRYVHAPGRVHIGLRRDGGVARLTIDDSGPGVGSADLPLLFEPLHRAERSRSREFGGSGLGLSISRRIVEAHGGSIAALASPLGGLRIEITLPLSA
jgi:two-component system sensor histidine kinase BaeS